MANTDDKYDELYRSMERTRELTYRSALLVLRELFQGMRFPASVIDIGCGLGDWLRAARACGARDVLGIDSLGTETSDDIPRRQQDLTQAWRPERRYELSLCMEVAEHLPASSAAALVSSLAAAAPVCVFSAAAPLQGGCAHINEQPPVYWARLFAQHGMECVDPRMHFWDMAEIEPWYRQNLLIFCTPGVPLGQRDVTVTPHPPHLIHPDLFAAYGGSKGVDIIWDVVDGRWTPRQA